MSGPRTGGKPSPTFIAVTALLAFVGLLAALIPARRAALVDPMIAMRSE